MNRYPNVKSDRHMERLMNVAHPDPDQSASPAGGVCMWNPDYACFDRLEPTGRTLKNGKPEYRRLDSYIYRGGARREMKAGGRL